MTTDATPNLPQPRHGLSDRALLQRIAEGDASALDVLRARHETAVYAQVFAVLSDAVDTEHVISETFLELSRQASAVACNEEAVHTVIRSIARGRAQALRRTRGYRRAQLGVA